MLVHLRSGEVTAKGQTLVWSSWLPVGQGQWPPEAPGLEMSGFFLKLVPRWVGHVHDPVPSPGPQCRYFPIEESAQGAREGPLGASGLWRNLPSF